MEQVTQVFSTVAAKNKCGSICGGRGGGGGVAVYANAATCLDNHKFPIEAVVEAWKFCGINILHWVVCIEVYANADCA